jgi:hypothetical protein
LAVVLATLVLSGCGEGGVSSGAAVSVYVAAPLCAAARKELRRVGPRVGELTVRAVCLPAVASRGGVDLAAAGADARRATEDSTAVAFLEAAGAAVPFSRSIVESADIAWIQAGSGAAAIHEVLGALERRGSSSPRSAVLDQVG